jgi:hypothetical protein
MLAAGLLAVAMVVASPGWAAQTRFKASLTPGEEVPGPGESGASGTAAIVLNPVTNYVCYTLNWSGLSGPPTAAHIHAGPKGQAGPIVVTLDVSNGAGSTSCVESNAKVVQAIQSNPEGHYVNIHTASHPKGAIRGQLMPE